MSGWCASSRNSFRGRRGRFQTCPHIGNYRLGDKGGFETRPYLPSGAERPLQRAQLLEPAGELVTFPRVRGIGHVFFGVLDHSGEQRAVELFEWHRRIRKHAETSWS